MHSPAWNTYAMAILGTLLVTFGLSYLGGTLFEQEAPETPGYVIAVAEPEGDTQTAEAGDSGPAPIATRLASADPEAGKTTARQCAACHNFEKGEGNKIGPILWNVVDREVASVPDFGYTDAMREFAKTEGTWTYEHLDTYLNDPKGLVPGTAMNFSGIKKPDARANVIAYLHTLSDNPAPLPEADAAPAAEGESAGGEQAAAEQPAAEQPAAEAPAAETQAAESQPAQPEAAPAAEQPAEPAQQQAAAEQPQQAAEAAPAGQESAPAASGGESENPELIAMIASSDPAAGQKLTSQCKACHTFEQGGPNRIGPNLWGVVGRPVASHEGFSYTDAMKQYGEKIGNWSYAHLSTYLADPRGQVPGTKMIFQGIKKEEDRAKLLAYLRTLSDNPQPLPGQ
ncbi:cytochrome c family protein [Afifella sp. IM 167]|uniref:c-type cytochrome n=1 Tax=Afifella sp. IM 167 TaxID=2033586 RepID=UPI001CCFCB63|nr:cytochrome c family protein [Afifella sp. IM 167]MBZ8133794.1 cytochrome Cy [Afifella sp. IM 167]